MDQQANVCAVHGVIWMNLENSCNGGRKELTSPIWPWTSTCPPQHMCPHNICSHVHIIPSYSHCSKILASKTSLLTGVNFSVDSWTFYPRRNKEWVSGLQSFLCRSPLTIYCLRVWGGTGAIGSEGFIYVALGKPLPMMNENFAAWFIWAHSHFCYWPLSHTW